MNFSEDAAGIEIKMVELTKDQNFNLLLIIENCSGNKKALKFLSILYKDLFYTKTYAEARHYVESLKIFADQKYADLDTDDFEVREKKDEKGRINHSFFCKFIKDENVYLSRATAKTITSMFLESTFSYPKQNLFENNLMAFPVHFTRYDMPEDIKKLLDNNVEKLEKAHLSQELKTYISTTLRNLYV